MKIPALSDIQATRARIDPYVVETPVWHWRGREISALAGEGTEIILKLELFQHTGTFKPRGALSVMLDLTRDELSRGVTAVSAGNHAIAVAYAANILGVTSRVVMMKGANQLRIDMCRDYGAHIELAENVHVAFERVKEIEKEEGRTFVHPFEGRLTSLGTATVALELCKQVPELDAVIVPIGGGGLCSGIALAVKLLQPACKVYGVEPEGADSMHRSFAAGRPESIDTVRTIADSLGAPYAEPYSFELCRRFVDELLLVSDQEILTSMHLLFKSMKLAVEPAGAAATAAMLGPLRRRLQGKRVGIIVCGTNIDVETFASQIATIAQS
jgi:threonine dehydratase